jgi:hypothetical protein
MLGGSAFRPTLGGFALPTYARELRFFASDKQEKKHTYIQYIHKAEVQMKPRG